MIRRVLKTRQEMEGVCGFSCIKGMTLIELMVSLAIGSIIIAILFEIYIVSVRSQHMQIALRNIQNNAERAIQILNLEVQLAGYIGCAKLSKDFPIVSYDTNVLNDANKIESKISNQISIRHAAVKSNVLLESTDGLDYLIASKNLIFSPNEIIIISDCTKAEIIKVKSVKVLTDTQIIYVDGLLHDAFNKNAEISYLENNTFYIANTKRINSDGTPIYALFVKDIKQRVLELVEGINSLKIEANHVRVSIELEFNTPPYKKKWYFFAKVN